MANRCVISLRLCGAVFGILIIGTAPCFAEKSSESSSKLEVFGKLRTALARLKRVGRIYYRGECTSQDVGPDAFPQRIGFPNADTRYPLVAHDTYSNLWRVFRGYNDIDIIMAPERIARIRINHPPEAILQTNIAQIRFTSEQQYDPRQAIYAVLQTKEVSMALTRLKARQIMRAESYINVKPTARSPHLPPSMTNATVDEILDRVAITFGGVVAYSVCAQPEVFDVEFVPIRKQSK